MIVKLSSLEETRALAETIASVAKDGDVITLKGQLGAGKSEFSRAFIKSLVGQSTIVPSPTFTILEQYQAPLFRISHFDLYRINKVEELEEIGFAEAIQTSLSLIEWPERLGSYHLDNLLQIELIANPITEERVAKITPDAKWVGRIELSE